MCASCLTLSSTGETRVKVTVLFFAALREQLGRPLHDPQRQGAPGGNRYSDAPNVSDRAAWKVVEKHCPGKSEAACRQIIKLWLKSGLLFSRSYENKKTRKPVMGLCVDDAKRPS